MTKTHSVLAVQLITTVSLWLCASLSHAAVVINKPDFSDLSGLTLNGDAAQVGNRLRVTPAIDWQAGSVFSTSTVSLTSNASFSTFFQFQFTDIDTGFCDSATTCGADGLVFVVQAVANDVGGAGVGIGYAGINNSVGVEFDNWNNGGIDQNSSNHVGINVNGDINSNPLAEVTEADMNDGDIWNVWIDYDSATNLFEARLTRDAIRPLAALVTTNLDLAAILGTTNAFVGFTSGTGASHANHDVLSWILEDEFAPIVPAPATWAVALLAVLGLVAIRRVTVI